MYDIITCFAIRRQRFVREGRFATRKKTTRGISVKLKNNVIWLIVHFFSFFIVRETKAIFLIIGNIPIKTQPIAGYYLSIADVLGRGK